MDLLRSWDGRLKDSVHDQKFKEELCLEIEKIFRDDREAAVALLVHFQGRALTLDEDSTTILLRYIRRFLPVFGYILIRPWRPLVMSGLSSTSRALLAELVPLLKDLLTVDVEYRGAILHHASPSATQALLLFARDNAASFLNLVGGDLRGESANEQRRRALFLLIQFAQLQGPNLDVAPKTATWPNLLAILHGSSDASTLVPAVLAFLLFLPSNLREFSSSDLFARLTSAIARLVPLAFAEDVDLTTAGGGLLDDLRDATVALLEIAFGLFPHHVLDFVREQRASPRLFQLLTELMRGLSFNPGLLSNAAESEFNEERWKHADISRDLSKIYSHKLLKRFEDLTQRSPSAEARPSSETFLDALRVIGVDARSRRERSTSSPALLQDLLDEVFVLQTRLMYEQYSQRLLAEQLLSSYKDEDSQRRCQERLAELDRELIEARRVQSQLLHQHAEQHRQAASLKEANSTMRAHLTKSTQLFQMREVDLKEQAAALTLEHESLRQQLRALTNERDQQAATIVEQQAILDSFQKRISDYESRTRRDLILQEELMVWHEQRREAESSRQRLTDAERELAVAQHNLAEMSRLAQQNADELKKAKQDKALAAHRIAEFELELERVTLQKVELKALLDASREMAHAKVEALAQRNDALRARSLLLEGRVLQLQAELEQGHTEVIK